MKKNITISLTDFINFIAGHQNKASVVNNIITRQSSSFYSKYYLPLQESIIAYHQQGRAAPILWDSLKQLPPGKDYQSQQKIYPLLLQNYLKTELAKTKTCISLPTTKGYFYHQNLTIKLNPELHLQYKRKNSKILKNYFIKLYYKKEALTKPIANTVIALMEDNIPPTSDFPTEYCILDLRRGKLFYKDNRIKNPILTAFGEAESFLTIWNYHHFHPNSI